jgi:hypothetical protein
MGVSRAGPRRWAVWLAAGVTVYGALAVTAFVIGPSTPAAPVKASCVMLGTGSGRTAGGDGFRFTILGSDTTSPRGAMAFADEGPASPSWHLQTSHISKITCSPGATTGTILGTGHLDSPTGPPVAVRVDLGLAGAAGTSPTVRVRLTGGYDTGTSTLARGSVTVSVPGRTHRAVASGLEGRTGATP